MQHSPFPALPCYPCPHQSSCCAYGTTLSDEEAEAITARHGPGLIYLTRSGEWRTRVRNRRCVFLANNVCTIYNKPYYPAVCRGFPWHDAETGGPYEYDKGICPEFAKRPELYEISGIGNRDSGLGVRRTAVPDSRNPIPDSRFRTSTPPASSESSALPPTSRRVRRRD